MGEHESCIGLSDEWYTPPDYFTAIDLKFDLDPCSPGAHHWVPARTVYTVADDGLRQHWAGRVFLNPPYGGREEHVPWLAKFLAHGDGIAIVRAYTSSGWFHDHAPAADAWLFPRGKTQFIRGTPMTSVSRSGIITQHEAGTRGRSPGHGVILLAMGDACVEALAQSGLGIFVDRRATRAAGMKARADAP